MLQKLAIENVDAIAKVAGVDVLMVGVTDLKATLGIPVRNPDGLVDESKFHDAIIKLKATSKNTGIQLMIPAFRLKAEDVEWLRDFKMVVTSVDILNVLRYHHQDLARMKEALGVEKRSANGFTDGCSHKAHKEDELASYHQNGDGAAVHEEEAKSVYKADSGVE
jgi:hypothetical protein